MMRCPRSQRRRLHTSETMQQQAPYETRLRLAIGGMIIAWTLSGVFLYLGLMAR